MFAIRKANDFCNLLALAQVASQPGHMAAVEVAFSSMGVDRSGKMKKTDKDMAEEDTIIPRAMTE